MTMPDERFRAIRWGGELLQAMQEDSSISEALKAKAQAIETDYPSDDILRQHLDATPNELPHAWLVAINTAEQLFRELQFSPDQGSEETRKHLRFAQRHFPTPGEALSRGRCDPANSLLGAWITPDKVRAS